ncbi:membrane-bound lytic murein transglycosylase MltC [Avibacterium paragallinarum]|uniref:Membrane-bound lytic murein transglycosylase C n=1 Tax=Avibacterium paragallinarum TaxID=728 RepID=A0AAE5WGE3_AVIPA|nr:membrane-bound lytic murein transglycosylase MltC [Avibacterium paragallinarum]MEE3609457.1 membrane-bound lytic murein transglycosylase MltC [Avibacterium paragallinarum]MEE3622179.1 membrane-bound lytic murein transglycosylase MltC [Avibacterium paragallinarum]MEE3668815.1 membrane-bound lytic murein transglycosylase MltC [Avibacterium paragallinarum]MEE3682012.1 membrane-bound lytic murein transglycosylase MltC [Avibacterium paragallinarum]MEE4386821.1 membrane-bound lytic murein transgl
MKKYVVALIIPFLFACGGSNHKGTDYDEPFSKDTQGLDILTGQFSHNIDQIWGVNELLVASRKDYVKYTDSYYTRSHVSFDEGVITVESQQDTSRLHNAIVHTLLMGSDAKGIDLFASGDVPISSRPFLAGQVVDNFGQQITNEFVAGNFADYLISNKLQSRRLSNGRLVQFVVIPMIANHVAVRAQKYIPMVRRAARKYNLDESLILGIMQTESSFNPYAISYANAIGLMQVVPHTAGRDVFQMKGRGGQPSKSYLFDPEKNIDAGAAYLWLLQNKYLDGITNPTSKRFAMISAYNSGAGAVLRVFHEDKEMAIAQINRLYPEQVYRILTTSHPSAQARNYLIKVDKAQKSYRVRR